MCWQNMCIIGHLDNGTAIFSCVLSLHQCVSIGEWKSHESDISSCAKACKLIFALSVIIDTAERVFLLLNYAFSGK